MPSPIQLLVSAAVRSPRARIVRIAAEHARARLRRDRDALHHGAPRERVTGRRAFGVEERIEGVERDFAALEARPRSARAGRHDLAIDEAVGNAELALVGGDRVQRRSHHHAAEVEDHRAQLAHGGAG